MIVTSPTKARTLRAHPSTTDPSLHSTPSISSAPSASTRRERSQEEIRRQSMSHHRKFFIKSDKILYIGESLNAKDYTWYLYGNEWVLLLSEELTKASEAKALHGAHKDSMRRPEPVVFSAVMELSHSNFSLDPHTWTDRVRNATGPLSAYLLRCQGAPPIAHRFGEDWATVLRNLGVLLHAFGPDSTGRVVRSGVLDLNNQSVELSHKLFLPRSNFTHAQLARMEALVPRSSWTHTSNPLSLFPRDLNALLREGAYVPVPLYAYDGHHKLLLPWQYLSYLRGATVRMDFSLSARRTGGPDVAFTATIESIGVLIPPVNKGPVMPSLKRMSAEDPLATPRKKSKAAAGCSTTSDSDDSDLDAGAF
ncbi:hypothetical protein BDN72DRAFT_902512 [Pluteus cervinus]|uniref:Uncharacterized protein n=1 Tax=Pluteus cervinus TaxID=181527 RepID=A0ACD3AEP9_9AGAR|nr:hypothetical protein BDN72DRAFT_902512 [Pluteus cervinus]